MGYEADGEASDWILGTYGIVAASPELGNEEPESEGFFIEERGVV